MDEKEPPPGLVCTAFSRALTRSASDASFTVQGCRVANDPFDESDSEVLFPDIYSLGLAQVYLSLGELCAGTALCGVSAH